MPDWIVSLNDAARYASVSVPFIALLTLVFASRYYHRQRVLELVKLIESDEVREARREVMQKLPMAKSDWVTCSSACYVGLANNAATIAAAYNNLGALLRDENWLLRHLSKMWALLTGYRRPVDFFADNWGESVVRVHARLEPYLEHRRKKPLQKSSYGSFSWLAKYCESRLKFTHEDTRLELCYAMKNSTQPEICKCNRRDGTKDGDVSESASGKA